MAATLRFLNSKRHEEGTMQKPSKTTTALPRRAILAGLAAAAPAAAIASLPSAVATEPDSIFAAIAAHERAAEAYPAALEKQYDDEAVELAAEADTETACAMVATVPTTLAGAIALMKYSMTGERRYGCEWPDLFDPEDPDYEHAKTWSWFLQRTLIRSLEAISA
ncbi:hypothetical protein [Bradyrhizobium niftali]|uniref:Uncharacterized protein n=1 Tax=Bradyrhizobium niftali TaxID=2560055 RepID=A0A4Y9LHZ5_9BRAD|nr:hypothetical protein [Bradyrhizobium niftali]TFV41362.1 hypothetical protein E4K65_36330 [Bradyrhizobium niftali]